MSGIDSEIRKVVKEEIKKVFDEPKYKVEAKLTTIPITFHCSLNFIPFVGLKLSFNEKQQFAGKITDIEWNDKIKTFCVICEPY